MSQAKQLADRFREVTLNGKWIARTNLKDALSGIGWEDAVKKNGSMNSIAALTFHIDYYIAGVLQVLRGGALHIRDKFSFDLPPVESQGDWERLREKLLLDAEQFAAAVEQLTDEQLHADFTDKKYGTYARNIEAMIEHGYYHLGQIVLLKKLLMKDV